MSGEIRVDTSFLAELETQYRDIAESLREVRSAPGRLGSALLVAGAYIQFQERWSWTRDKFIDAAEQFADAVRTVSESFTTADQEIAESLDGG